MYVAQSV